MSRRYVGSSIRNFGGRGAGEIALIQRVSHRCVEQIWQAYKQTGSAPTLETPGRPKGEPIPLHEAALVLKVYDVLKVNALTLEHVLRDVYRVTLPHNRIHMILKENGRAMPQPSKQRRNWIRYEREHSMSLCIRIGIAVTDRLASRGQAMDGLQYCLYSTRLITTGGMSSKRTDGSNIKTRASSISLHWPHERSFSSASRI